ETGFAPLKAGGKAWGFSLDLKSKSAAPIRQQIEKGEGLPPPPPGNLGPGIPNARDKEEKNFVCGEGTALTMNLTGPGVITAAAPANFQADFLVPQTIKLPASQSHVLPITYLVYGSREKPQAAYWTEPGQYTLTLRYKVAISNAQGQDMR